MPSKTPPTLSSRPGTALGAAGAAAGLLALLVAGCRGSEPGARAEAALLQRQNQGLRELIAEAEAGALFSSEQLAIGLRTELVQDLLQRRLPVETVLLDRLRVRIETAEIDFESSQGLVNLRGRVSLVGAADAYADILLLGGLHRFEVVSGSGTLTAHLDLDRVEIERLEAGELERGLLVGLTETLGGRSLGALGEILPRVEIPVHLDQAIEFGGFSGGGVSVPPKRLPLQVSVARVTAVAGRLWVLLDVVAREEAAGPTPPVRAGS